MLKLDKNFHWYKQIRYVEKMFRKTFKKEIELKEFYYTNEANYGAFGFKYYYFPKDLILFFDYQSLHFGISLIRNDGLENIIELIVKNNSRWCPCKTFSTSEMASIQENFHLYF